MNVTINRPSDDSLEAVSYCLVSDSPLVKTRVITRRNVRDNDSNFTSFFDSMECFIKPLENTTWIISLTPKIEVEIVAGLRVNGYDVDSFDFSSVLELKLLGIKSNISIHFLSFLI
jgi:hypothetical protein